MNLKFVWMAACLSLLSSAPCFAQEPLAAVKLGYNVDGIAGRKVFAAYERTMIVPGSIQAELGFGHRTWEGTGGSTLPELSFHAGLEARFHVALRRGQNMSGFYLGPTIALYRRQAWVRDPRYLYSVVQSPFGGITLGYQHAFWDWLRLDGGIKFGAAYPTTYDIYNADGGLVRRHKDFGFSGVWYLQIGYAF